MSSTLQFKFNFEQLSNNCVLFNRPSRFESSDSENDQQEVELNGQQQTRKSPRKIQKKIAPPSLPSLPTPPPLPSLPSLQKKPKPKRQPAPQHHYSTKPHLVRVRFEMIMARFQILCVYMYRCTVSIKLIYFKLRSVEFFP